MVHNKNPSVETDDSSLTDKIKFKTFVMLFFQDSIQDANKEIAHQKDLRIFYMKNMRKLLHMKEEDILKMKEVDKLGEAYKDYLKLEEDLE